MNNHAAQEEGDMAPMVETDTAVPPTAAEDLTVVKEDHVPDTKKSPTKNK